MRSRQSPSPGPQRTDLRRIQHRILAYVLDHPEAKDSLEGIRHWWLTGPQRGLPEAQILAALEGLIRSGLISAVGRGEGAVYGMRQGHEPEIRAFLEE